MNINQMHRYRRRSYLRAELGGGRAGVRPAVFAAAREGGTTGEGRGGRRKLGRLGAGEGVRELVRGKRLRSQRRQTTTGTRRRQRDRMPAWSPEGGGAGVAVARALASVPWLAGERNRDKKEKTRTNLKKWGRKLFADHSAVACSRNYQAKLASPISQQSDLGCVWFYSSTSLAKI